MSQAHYFISERWTGQSFGQRYHTWASQDVGTTRKEVFQQIVDEELAPCQILEVIPDEQVINDITRDIASDLKEYFANEGVPPRLVDFIESNTVGFVRDARVRRSCCIKRAPRRSARSLWVIGRNHQPALNASWPCHSQLHCRED